MTIFISIIWNDNHRSIHCDSVALYCCGDIHDNHNCDWGCNLKAWFNFIQLFTFLKVDVDVEVESTESFPISEEIRIKAQSLRYYDLAHYFQRSCWILFFVLC